MPKSRSSNTIASRGSTSLGASMEVGSGAGISLEGMLGVISEIATTIDEAEVVQRLEDRLNEVTTVDITIPSITRRRDEQVRVTFNPDTPGLVTVASPSGSTYDVNYDDDTCTCMHYRNRGNGCRHIDAAHLGVGQLMNDRYLNTAPGQAISTSGVDNIISNQQSLDEQAEAHRMELNRVHEDDGFFYSDNPREFENTMERLKYEPLPYEYENALNGNNTTFGIELEFVNGNSDAIARDLYREGICAYPEMIGYHSRSHPSVPGKWKMEYDGSVSNRSTRRGGELVSPILSDTPETWKTIERVCEVAKRHGAQVNYKCGGHVHVDMEPLDTARQRWRRFFKSISGYEEAIYRFAGGTQGRYRINPNSDYAAPFESRARQGTIARFEMNNEEDVRDLARRIGGPSDYDRYKGINLTNIRDNKIKAVEFRYFNGSLEPSQIQANIKMAVGVMTASEKAKTRNTTESMERRGTMLKNTTLNERSNEAIMKFVDVFFTRKKDKDHILGVMAKNVWR